MLNFNVVERNRNTAVFNKDYGVGKINAIIRRYKDDPENLFNRLYGVAVKALTDKECKNKTDVVYAAIEALSHYGGQTAAKYIIDLNSAIMKYSSSASKEEKQQIKREIAESEKMNVILFEAYANTKQFNKARKLLPKPENSSSSHSLIALSNYFNEEAKNLGVSDEDIEKAKAEINQGIANSIKFLDKKFNSTFDFSTGVELLRLKLSTGSKMPEISKLAGMVYLSSKKFNVQEFSKDKKFSDLIFVAGLAKVDKKEIETLLKTTSLTKTHEYAIIEDLKTSLPTSRSFKELSEEEKKSLTDYYKGAITFSRNESQNEKTDGQKKTNAILAGSYSYAGTLGNIEEATYLGGNLGFSGQVPDHCITKNDVKIFDTLIQTEIYKLFPLADPAGSKSDPNNRKIPEELNGYKTMKLSELEFSKDMNVFMKVTDGMIRNRFTTTNFAGQNLNMEEQALLTESVYNDAFKSIMAESGSFGLNVDGNSLTNITTLFAEGLGDCRHHAQIKQIMFDRWKDQKMNQAIISLGQESTSESAKSSILNQIEDMSRTELRTFDVSIKTNLNMEQSAWGWQDGKGNGGLGVGDCMYRPARDEEGKFSVREDGMSSPLEEHTMCMLVKRDKEGSLEELRFADAFYHNPDGKGDYDLSYNQGQEMNLVDAVEVVNGKYAFNPGNIFNSENVAGERDVEVVFAPTAYAGKRDYELFGRFEHSQLCGIKYEREISTESMLDDIALSDENHKERIDRAHTYSTMRKIIVKNMIANNIREEKTLDIPLEVRENLETVCSSKNVTEMTEEEIKTLNGICNGLSEMRSPKFCDIYYLAAQKLKSFQQTSGTLEIDDATLESICNEAAAEYIKANKLGDKDQNRTSEVEYCQNLVSIYMRTDNSETEQKRKVVKSYLSTRLPQEEIEAIMNSVNLNFADEPSVARVTKDELFNAGYEENAPYTPNQEEINKIKTQKELNKELEKLSDKVKQND